MAFSTIAKRKLFDALWNRSRKGQKAPSLRLIAKEARLPDDAAAERLLREMEADGAISVVRIFDGGYPWLTLRRAVYNGDFIGTAVWLDAERMAEKLEAREAEAAPVFVPLPESVKRHAPNEMPERPKVETVEAQRESEADAPMSPGSVDQGPRPAPPPAQAAEEPEQARGPVPQAVEARHDDDLPDVIIRGDWSDPFGQRKVFRPKAGNYPCGACTRAIAVTVPEAVHAALDAEAKRLGISTERHTANVLVEACTASECDTRRKHRISAAVQRACREDGRPLPEFVTALVELGLEEYLRFLGMAEAAE